jgi:hypothetical protein
MVRDAAHAAFPVQPRLYVLPGLFLFYLGSAAVAILVPQS